MKAFNVLINQLKMPKVKKSWRGGTLLVDNRSSRSIDPDLMIMLFNDYDLPTVGIA